MFRWISDFYRLFYINYILMRYGVGRVVFSSGLLGPWRFLHYLNPFSWFAANKHSPGESVRLAFEALGPIFVKFGQALSTRRDFIPDDIADELEKLVDSVPGFPGELTRQKLEKIYGRSLSEVFAEFIIEPIAAASIAQVHKALLLDGTQVAVKVLRPKIRRQIERDIRLMYFVARLVMRFYSEGYRLKPVEVVAEFHKTIIDELDLMREGSNASQLRRNFSDSDVLYVPEVFWDYTREEVLVTEFIHGIPITNIEALRASHVNMKLLADRGVQIFFTQVFRDSFFHADMHRGNILVDTQNPEDPKYLALDFGIIGVLSPVDQRYLAENLLAFFRRDYRQVAVLHVESGWVPADTRVEDFESAIRAVCEPIFEKPLSEISFGQLLLRLFQTASRFRMELQPQLLLLQKTLLNVEGIGRQLYPDLDLWATAKPFLESWLKNRISPRAILRETKEKAPFWLEKFPDVPDLLYKLLKMRSDTSNFSPVVDPRPSESRKKSFWGVVGLTLLAASGVYWFFAGSSMEVRQQVELALAGLGGFLVLVGLFSR